IYRCKIRNADHPRSLEKHRRRKVYPLPMNPDSAYYELSSTTRDPCTMEKRAYEQARNSWLCGGCGFPKGNVKGIDSTIQEDQPEETPLNFISGSGLGIARKQFLRALGEETANRELYLGQLFGPDGSLLEDWVTFVGKYRI